MVVRQITTISVDPTKEASIMHFIEQNIPDAKKYLCTTKAVVYEIENSMCLDLEKSKKEV